MKCFRLMWSTMFITSLAFLVLLPASTCFTPALTRIGHSNNCLLCASSASADSSSGASSSSTEKESGADDNNDDGWWKQWSNDFGIVAPKLSVRKLNTEERGKGGVYAKDSISALEVVARIPRGLVLASCDSPPRALEAAAKANELSWASDLTAVTISNLFPSDEELNLGYTKAKQTWIENWKDGGWATDNTDLGPSDVSWGSDSVTGSLMSTGSDNDRNIYAKFRLPCHPMVHHASRGLAMLAGVDGDDALEALLIRGRIYRSMKDALLVLVDSPSDRKGSLRERRSWDVADILSKVLSRATTIQLKGIDDEYAIVPLHERLAQCDDSSQNGGENTKLVVLDDEVLLVATTDISIGDAITRDYNSAPKLEDDTSTGPLRLLLQFGLPPSAW